MNSFKFILLDISFTFFYFINFLFFNFQFINKNKKRHTQIKTHAIDRHAIVPKITKKKQAYRIKRTLYLFSVINIEYLFLYKIHTALLFAFTRFFRSFSNTKYNTHFLVIFDLVEVHFNSYYFIFIHFLVIDNTFERSSKSSGIYRRSIDYFCEYAGNDDTET